MGLLRFGRPHGKDGDSSPNLYVANCGPAVGISFDTIASVFGTFGEVRGVYAADDSGTRVVVSFAEEKCAETALRALNGRPCPELQGRFLHIQYSILQPPTLVQSDSSVPVSLQASEVNIPGLYLWHDFISSREEEDMLTAVDHNPWRTLAKRRVQHYGYEFLYDRRNVDTEVCMGELPSFFFPVLERIKGIPHLNGAANICLDQLTVNEYPSGVGLSPHIDTHSAFEGLIFSLSLAGPCIMELRRYSEGAWSAKHGNSDDGDLSCRRKSLYLPPRSLLLLSGEARYAWHHYIPHHKIDHVGGSQIRRASRRVSFTIRKVRKGPCKCEYPQYCDSQS